MNYVEEENIPGLLLIVDFENLRHLTPYPGNLVEKFWIFLNLDRQ